MVGSAPRLTRVLGAPVRVGGERVGEVTGIVADDALARVLGFEVTGRVGARFFLPLIATHISERGLSADSPLVLIEVDGFEGLVRSGARVFRDVKERAHALIGPEGTVLEAV